jgi:oligo-1,6-glucosidase
MINMPKDWPEAEYIDPMSWMFMQDIRKDIKHGIKGITEEGAFKSIQTIGRDHARVPMQWSREKSAGFSTNEKTWMRVNDFYKEGINVADEEKDTESVLQFYRKMLAFRKQHSASLIFGEYKGIEPENELTMQYFKKAFDGETLFVALNFAGEKQKVSIPNEKVELLLSTSASPENEHILQPYEGRIYKA